MQKPANPQQTEQQPRHTETAANAACANTAANGVTNASCLPSAGSGATHTQHGSGNFVFDRLVLASASPRRSFLLGELGLGGFTIDAANVDEHEDPRSCPRQMVRHNALIKAEAVSARHPRSLILGSDTTVALEDEVLNKPADMEEARAMLRKLSGRTHTVYTGICLISPADGLHEVHHVTSNVTFHALGEQAITAYFQVVNPLDKAGAYGIQEGRELIIASLDGSLENVMGLPIQFLEQRWRQLGCWPRLQQLHPLHAAR